VLAAGPLRPAVARVGRWRGVLVLSYHRIGDSAGQPWDRTLWSAGADALDEQLAILARDADVIDVADVADALREPAGRRVLLTFDDGYRDNHDVAFPLLRRHGLPAVFFLATGFLDRPHVAWWDEIAWMVTRSERHVLAGAALPSAGLSLGGDGAATIAQLIAAYKRLPGDLAEDYLDRLAGATGVARPGPADAQELWMTWAMARELRDSGMAIGGHTVTHPVLARAAPELQHREIVDCARRLHDELDVAMRWFAYPVGARDTFTAVTREILADCGVELAFSSYGGLGLASRWDPLDVPRVHVGREYGPRLLQAAISLPRLFARW